MRTFAQDRALNRWVWMDGTDDEEAQRRLWIVGIEEMRERFPAEACRTFGVARATYYEWRRLLCPHMAA